MTCGEPALDACADSSSELWTEEMSLAGVGQRLGAATLQPDTQRRHLAASRYPGPWRRLPFAGGARFLIH
jgi:hypothetical protein